MFSRLAAAPVVALAAVLCIVGQGEIWTARHLGGIGVFPVDAPRPVLAALAVVATCAVALCRVAPVTAAGIVAAAVVAQVVTVVPAVSLVAGLLPLLIVMFAAGAYGRAWRQPIGLALGLLVVVVLVDRIPEEHAVGEIVFGVFVVTSSWVLGYTVGHRVQRADEAVQVATKSLDVERRRVLVIREEERARIARELHDVIAHGVSVMGVQAAVARVQVDADPSAARKTLSAVEDQARECIAELQRLLDVLRGPESLQREPQPGLLDLPSLVRAMQAAGMPVTVRTVGSPRQLNAGTDLAAYRVVQEALTNALKHAGPVPVTVHLAWTLSSLQIEVRDEGEPRPVSTVTGHGLIGMRERVSLYGGRVETGPQSGGGFLVQATFPLESAA